MQPNAGGILDAVFNEGSASWQGGENVCKTLLQLGYLGSLAQRKMTLRMHRREQRRFLDLQLTFLNYRCGQSNRAFLVL